MGNVLNWYKGLLLSSLLLFCSTFVPAQKWDWANKVLGTTSEECGRNIVSDLDGNIYAIGFYKSSTLRVGTAQYSNKGVEDIFIVKYSESGSLIWSAVAGSISTDIPYQAVTDHSGNLYIIGYYSNSISFGSKTLTNSGGHDIFVVRYSSNGIVDWALKIGGSGDENGYGIAIDDSANIYITGRFTSTSVSVGTKTMSKKGNGDIFIAKLDSSANALWTANYGTSGYENRGTKVSVDNDRNIYMTGRFMSPNVVFGGKVVYNASSGTNDLFLVKYNKNYDVIWAQNAGYGSSEDQSYGMTLESNGNIYICGFFSSTSFTIGSTTLTSSGNQDAFIAAFDTSGSVKWVQKGGGTSNERYENVAVDHLGNVYAIGWGSSSSIVFSNKTIQTKGADDCFIVKYNNKGVEEWVSHIASTGTDKGIGICSGPCNDIFSTGQFSSAVSFGTLGLTSSGGIDFFSGKIFGNIEFTSTITGPDTVTCKTGDTGHIAITDITCGTPPFRYAWSTGATTAAIYGVGPGTYTVVITDKNGYKNTKQWTIHTDSNSAVIQSSTKQLKCYGDTNGEIQLNVSGLGPFSYQWSTSDTTEDLYHLPNGIYKVNIYDKNQCLYVRTFEIAEPDLIKATFHLKHICSTSDGQIKTSIQGGIEPYAIKWSNGDTTASIINLIPGFYFLHLVDSNNCVFNDSLQIYKNPDLKIKSFQENDISCFGYQDGNIEVIMDGGYGDYSYLWSNSDTTSLISDLAKGIYYLTVTDSNDCMIQDTFYIEEPEKLKLGFDLVSHVSCFGYNDGFIFSKVSGGIKPYDYLWSNSATDSFLTKLSKGKYILSVTDLNGCDVKDSLSINEPTQIMVQHSITDAHCYNEKSGSIDLSVSGGILPYTFLWSDSSKSEDINNVLAGFYEVIVKDSHLCIFQKKYEIKQAAKVVTGSIVGKSTVNEYENVDYAVSQHTGSIYDWWVDNGAVMSGQGTNVVNIKWGAKGDGMVYVIETNSSGCKSDTNKYKVAIDKSHISDLVISGNLKLFPNPASKYLLITGIDEEIIEASVFNELGEECNVPLERKQSGIQLDISGLISGFYFIKIKDRNNTGYFTKFVKAE